MQGVVAINGEVLALEEASVPVLDRGFLYGDSVYEVIRTYGGVPFALAEHLERLARSAALVEIDLPVSIEQLEGEISSALRAAGRAGEWYLRLILTRGGGQIGLDPALAESPRRIIIVLPVPSIDPSLWTSGASVVLVPTGRRGEGAIGAGAKTGNYLTNIIALRRARERGAFEAIMVDAEGRIAEGTTSNVFLVREGIVYTPTLAVGILDGITRRKVIELSERDGLEVRQAQLRPLDVHSADELFITGTLKEVLPVTRVDDNPVGGGSPGPITLRIQRLYRELIESRAS